MSKCLRAVLAPALLVIVAGALAPLAARTAVVEIPIEGTIEMGLAPFVERAIEEAAAGGADAILLRVDTFGGRIDAAVKIRDAILRSELPTIAWVEGRAISAGALITLAADSVVLNEGATIGAAQPVQIGGSGETQETGEKTVSYFRGEMRATAEATGRDPRVAEAMVDRTIEIEGIIAEDKLLTLTSHEALELGMADHVVSGRRGLIRLMGWEDAVIQTVAPTWSEWMVRFLTHPVVAGLLLSIGGLALLLELRTPGVGLPGLIAIICFALFFGAHYLVNLAGNVEVLLFLAGLVLLVLEIFVIPGFGIAGILGIIFLMAGLLLSRVAPHGGLPDFTRALGLLIASFFVTLVLFLALLRYLPQARWMGGIVLETRQERTAGFHSDEYGDEHLEGRTGICLSDLRPAGIAEIDGRRIDVVTEGGYIEKGTRIRIAEVSGNRVVVEALRDENEA
ncbi:MAG: nodulation protein NfeD [Candidatus Krumholzibacteriota bacterium]|nr:nodulation protein NfeD [Candidatus Krumholzibacteriota bacterium]